MLLPSITVYAPSPSPRLTYVLHWLLTERLGFTYTLTHNKQEATAAKYCIAYGHIPEAVNIHATGLLYEVGIREHEPETRDWQGLYVLYFDERHNSCDIAFDMLSGIFYLLSRYEEYYPDKTDRHGRYRYRESVLASNEEDNSATLSRPVADEWIEHLRQLLERRWSITIPKPSFSIEPTYDIDIAWAYKHKGLKRVLGAALRDVASLKAGKIKARFAAQDPYDAFDWIEALHGQAATQPQYFILTAEKATAFDKNISPHHPAMQELIKRLSGKAQIGLHPSYYSTEKPALLTAEKVLIESITGKPIHTSRQHYIRLSLPHTYRTLVANGITDDYSMGYTTITGFRAGTSHPFPWYDLEEETAAPLRIHPFAFMDTTAHYYMQCSAKAAFQNLNTLKETLKPIGGNLTTVFHNFSLGTDKEWAGWREAYQAFLLQ